MSDLVYDMHFTFALDQAASRNGLSSQSRSQGTKQRQVDNRVKRWAIRNSRTICRDIVIYDKIVIPEYFSAYKDSYDGDLKSLIDVYPIERIPKYLDRVTLRDHIKEDFLRFAIQLKPFFIKYLAHNMRPEESEGSLFHPILRCRGGNVVQDFVDLYDYFFCSILWDPNSALECITNYELRMYIIEWFLNNEYYESRQEDGMTVFALEDKEIQKGFNRLLGLLWEPCYTVDFSSRFNCAMRTAWLHDYAPQKTASSKRPLVTETPIKEALVKNKRDDAYLIVKQQLANLINIAPDPRDLNEALKMRNRKEWVRFREHLSKYQQLLEQGESDISVAKEVLRDIQLSQKELSKASSSKRISSYMGYVSMATSAVELYLNIPSFASILLAVVALGYVSRADTIIETNDWIGIGDLKY